MFTGFDDINEVLDKPKITPVDEGEENTDGGGE